MFFIWVFFIEHSQFQGQEGKGNAISWTPLYHFHPLYRHLDIGWAITAESSLGVWYRTRFCLRVNCLKCGWHPLNGGKFTYILSSYILTKSTKIINLDTCFHAQKEFLRYCAPEKACNFIFSIETHLKIMTFKKTRKLISRIDQKYVRFYILAVTSSLTNCQNWVKFLV